MNVSLVEATLSSLVGSLMDLATCQERTERYADETNIANDLSSFGAT